MATTKQPLYVRDDRTTLATIIQGEAGGEGQAGMNAVASVIQNRANSDQFSNYSGRYSNPYVSQALGYNQFQGQIMQPSQAAYDTADNLLSGNIQDNTGGATFYARPSNSTAGNWGSRLTPDNSYQIGNHLFTDNMRGDKFSGPTADSVDDAGSGAGTGNVSAANSAGGPMLDADGALVITGKKSNTQENNDSVSGSSSDPAGAGARGSSGSDPGTSGLGGVGGSPTVQAAIDKQTAQLKSNTEAETKTATANTGATNAANAALVSSGQTYAQNLFIRAGFVLLGLIFVAMGLAYLFPKVAPVQLPFNGKPV